MPTGYETLGAAIGGDSEKSYQEGINLGARTQDALAQARQRVDENKAREELAGTLEKVLPPQIAAASAATVRAGGNLGDVISAMQKNQEFNFRATAGSPDPNVGGGERNRALFGVASGPVKTLEPVGSHGYTDILAPEKGVMPLGTEIGGGGDSAALQAAHALGIIDDNGRVLPNHEAEFFDIVHPTGRVLDAGGVPYTTDFNPYRAGRPGSKPSGSPQATPGAPAGSPQPTAVAAPAAPAVPLNTTAQNAGTIASAKKVGEAQGEKAAALPSTLLKLDDFEHNVDNLLAQPGFGYIYGHLAGTDIGQAISAAGSQDAANAQAALQQIDAQSFGISIQQMRGLGQLSNQEGLKVQKAFALATNPRLSPEAAKKAFLDMKGHLAQLRAVAQQEAGVTGAPAAPGPATPGATDRKTVGGKTYVNVNGQWYEDDGT